MGIMIFHRPAAFLLGAVPLQRAEARREEAAKMVSEQGIEP